MEQQEECAYCGQLIDSATAERGITTKKAYCPEKHIEECLATFGDRVEYIDYSYKRVT